MGKKTTKLTFIGDVIEQKGYSFVDLDTDLIIVSRDPQFIELGNDSSSVGVKVTEPKKTPVKEDIQVIPIKEGKKRTNEEAHA